jgi:hypothetical protein
MSDINKTPSGISDRRLTWSGIIMCSLLIGAAFWLFPLRDPYEHSDLAVYGTAFSVAENGGNPYDPAAMVAAYRRDLGIETQKPGMMWNPPAFLLFPGLLLHLPQPWAFEMMPFLSVLSAFTLVILGWRFAGTATTLTTRTALISCVSIPLLVQICISQLSSIVVLPVLIGSLLFLQRRDFGAGLLLSFAILKPHLVLLPMVAIAFWAVLQRRWRVLAGFVIGCIASSGLAEMLYPHTFSQWLHRPSWPLNLSGAAFPTIMRGFAVNTWNYDPVVLEVLIPLFGAATLLACLWRCHKTPSGQGIVWSIVLNMLFTPYGYVFDQSLGIAIQSFLLAQSQTQKERTVGVRLILLVNLIPCLCLALLPSWLALWWMSYPVLLALCLALRSRWSPQATNS